MIRTTEATDRRIERPSLARRLRWPLIVVVVLATLAAAAYPAMSRWVGASGSVARAQLRFTTVERGDLDRDISVEGRVVAVSHPTAFSPAAGIVRVHVAAGETVETGTPLATVESPELENRLARERSQLAARESELATRRLESRRDALERRQRIDQLEVEAAAARRDLERAEAIREAGLINVVELEEARDAVTLGELALEHAEKQAELAADTTAAAVSLAEEDAARQRLVVSNVERQVTELTVTAPVTGMVSRLDVQDRDAVTIGQALVTVVDLSAYEVEIAVPEGWADEVTVGTRAELRIGDDLHEGAVRVMAPEVSSGTVAGRVAFATEPPAGLKQNQRLRARLVLDARFDVLTVERGPFIDTGAGRVAYLVDDGVLVRRRIETGAVGTGRVEVTSGLEIGDVIVLSDIARFDDAERVLLRD
ncbi:MAG: HlyD family efflux transporter periplasmic adaptor subunit [Acidobacteriota bacterium]